MTLLFFVADHQVFAEVIESIDIVACHRGLQNGSHLLGKHLIAQALRLTDFIKMPGPAHLQAQGWRNCIWRGRAGKRNKR